MTSIEVIQRKIDMYHWDVLECIGHGWDILAYRDAVMLARWGFAMNSKLRNQDPLAEQSQPSTGEPLAQNDSTLETGKV